MDSQIDASSDPEGGVSELLPPSRALVTAPVGEAPEHVRAWFDSAVEASDPVIDGTLASDRDAADTYRRMAKADNTPAPTAPRSGPGVPGAPGMTSLPCPPPARMSPPSSPAKAGVR